MGSTGGVRGQRLADAIGRGAASEAAGLAVVNAAAALALTADAVNAVARVALAGLVARVTVRGRALEDDERAVALLDDRLARRDGVSLERRRPAEARATRRRQLVSLRPRVSFARKHEQRAGAVVLVIIALGADDRDVPLERHGSAEVVAVLAVAGEQLLLLAPHAHLVACPHDRRPGVRRELVVLDSASDDRVARDGHGGAQVSILRDVPGAQDLLLAPHAHLVALEHEDPARVTVAGAGRPDNEQVARERDGCPEAIPCGDGIRRERLLKGPDAHLVPDEDIDRARERLVAWLR